MLRLLVSAGVAFAVLAGVTVARPAIKLQPLAELPAEDPLEVSDIVVRGVVNSVVPGEFDLSSGAPGTTPSVLKSFTTRLSVSEVLRGKWDEPEITFAILRDFEPLQVGIECIICGVWNKNRATFVSGPYIGVFEKDQAGQWVKRGGGPTVDKVALTSGDVRAHVKRGSLDSIVRHADIIAKGSITEIEEASYTSEEDRRGAMSIYKMKVNDLLKGSDDDGQIEFVVPHFTPHVPAWTRPCPTINTGEEWLVFLKNGELGLYPFGGSNSLLRVNGNSLMYRLVAEYPLTVPQAIQHVRSEVRRERQ